MIEKAVVLDDHNVMHYVYGTYEEVEAFAKKINGYVVRYLDHVAPFVVQKNFTYVGKQMGDPYSVSVPWNYEKGVADVTDKW